MTTCIVRNDNVIFSFTMDWDRKSTLFELCNIDLNDEEMPYMFQDDHGKQVWITLDKLPKEVQKALSERMAKEGPMPVVIKNISRPTIGHKLFAIYHNHEYGSTQWLLWSGILPTEEQVIESLGIDFEPEKDEFIAVEEITEIHTLKLS